MASSIPSLGAEIISLGEFAKLRPTLVGKLVVTSGPFDPIHPGHISCIFESKKLGDVLAVVVNGDAMLRMKKGKEFQDLRTRSMIVSALPGVDYVIPFEIENDMTVIKALEAIKPDIFAKGGDRRDAASIPEWDICQKNGTEIVTNVGLDKEWSSSDFLRDWAAFVNGA